MKSKELKQDRSPRERILEAAIDLFNRRGIRATGVDTLIEQSGVAKMTFYKHFPTKQALVMEYLRERDFLLGSRFKMLLHQRDVPPRQRLLGIFDILKELYDDPKFRGCVFINAIIESRNPESQEHLFSAQHKKAIWNLLKETADEAKIKRSSSIADELYLLFQGAVITTQIENSAKSIQVAKEIAQLLLQKS